MTRWLSMFMLTASKLDDRDQNDELCCIFAEDWTRAVWGDAVDRAPRHLWRLWTETPDGTPPDPYGPVTAVVVAGLHRGPVRYGGGKAPPSLADGELVRCQGWRGRPFGKGVSGHTVTVLGGPAGQCLVFDSAAKRNERVTSIPWADYAAQFEFLAIVPLM